MPFLRQTARTAAAEIPSSVAITADDFSGVVAAMMRAYPTTSRDIFFGAGAPPRPSAASCFLRARHDFLLRSERFLGDMRKRLFAGVACSST
jgi:hypothetical protein